MNGLNIISSSTIIILGAIVFPFFVREMMIRNDYSYLLVIASIFGLLGVLSSMYVLSSELFSYNPSKEQE